CPRAVSIMMGMAGFLDLSCLQTSSPLMRGIITSRITRSGDSLSARSSPATPSAAVTTSYPSNSKLSRRPATMLGSSSTMRILVIAQISKAVLRRCCLAFPSTCIQRQSDDELAAASRRTVHQDRSAVRLDDVPDQRKPQARPLGVVHQRISDPIKLFEY